MKNSLLLIGAIAVIFISTAIRSQEPADNVEALLKVDEAVPVEAVQANEVVPAEVADVTEEAAAVAVDEPQEAVVAEAVASEAASDVEVLDVSMADEAATEEAASILGDGTISVVFDDTPIAEVIKLFSQLSGANIIAATSNLTGTISANLKNVAWQPAFEAILGRHSLILSEKPVGSGIYVVESSRAGEEPTVTETIPLKYAKADRMATLITSMLGSAGRATPFADGNALLVRGEWYRTWPGLHDVPSIEGLAPGVQSFPIAQARMQHRQRSRQALSKAGQ